MQLQSLFRVSLLCSFLMFFIIPIQAQQGKVWATIPIKKAPKLVDGKWVSDDPSFNKAMDDLHIQSIKKALPSSRSVKLQQVYEITCDCDEVDLYTTLTNNVQVLSGIEYAPKYETLDIPNDYTSIISPSAYALDLINAPSAWDITHGDPNVYVAISDQNIHANHPDLIDEVIYNNPANNMGPQGHGTAVAITAAGATNNGAGISSIGYDTKLALYQMDFDDVLAASYAGARVINMSWTSSCDYEQYAQDVISEVYNNGTFLVASAGNGTTCNDPSNFIYPASYDHVFSVTSVGPNNNHEKVIGNPNSTHQHNSLVDLNAPGYNVFISAAPGWNLFANGTSYAAAYVTGTIGLMLAVNPNLTNDDIEEILKSSSFYVDDVNPSYTGLIGAGRLDAHAAVAMALGSNCNLTVDAGNDQTSYFGYQPNECVQLSGMVSDGTAPYQFEWVSNSGTFLGSDITICPENSDVYTLTVSDATGCSASDEVEVCVINVECSAGNSGKMKVEMCQIPQGNPNNAHTICVSPSSVPAHLANGCLLGACDEQNNCGNVSAMNQHEWTLRNNSSDLLITAYPNPTNSVTTISLSSNYDGDICVSLTDMSGRILEQLYKGGIEKRENRTFDVNLESFDEGVYLLNLRGSNQSIKSVKIFKD
jgi:hypothetical protein